jgi:serum/glucocorticoid-regulated kinase 2
MGLSEFFHEFYDLDEKTGELSRKHGVSQPLTAEEQNRESCSVLEALTAFVQARMISLGLIEHWIPDVEEEARCNIFISDLAHSTKLLIILQNQVGSKPGLWSRSLCLAKGLHAGGMLTTIQRALCAGFAVAVLNPNTNSVCCSCDGRRRPIANSFTPENHVLHVWDSLIAPFSNLESVYLLTNGNGSSLAVDIVQRQMVRCAENPNESMRIRAIACIEPSQLVDGGESGGDNDAATKAALRALTLAFEGHDVVDYPIRLLGAEEKLGCTCISVGSEIGADPLAPNVASSVGRALDSVLRFFEFATRPPATATELGEAFAAAEVKAAGIESCMSRADGGKSRNAELVVVSDPIHRQRVGGYFGRIFSSGFPGRTSQSKKAGVQQHLVSRSLTVSDFDLLRVVGKGAFGKVMLVRKKHSQDAARIFAMKVLKKSVIAAKGQTEHTRSERSILCEIRHPYIVRLRYAFQSDEKLYLVTDYYNGGSLFYHLRKSRGFSDPRARFYAGELILALDHLHNSGIIYRDLKLENILMDHVGHIALTDFGLSKENVTDVFNSQLTTFCGTAEYIAPELLKGQKYGASVDWWSFGILLYEMMGFRTPFYDKNRKLMFHGIINLEPSFPAHFTVSSKNVLLRLLDKEASRRLGSKGAEEIKMSEFFKPLDFQKLIGREITPPFKPEVSNEEDTKYVPKAYLAAKPEDSIDHSSGKQKHIQQHFQDFTFNPSLI